MEMKCIHCGKIRNLPPAIAKKQKFCSIECRKLHSRYPVQCRGCGQFFTRNPKSSALQYCSWECFKASRHVMETCHVCGKEFVSYLSEHHRRIAKHHVPCCSRACRNRYTSLLLGGDGNWVEGGRYNPKRKRGSTWRKVRQAYLESIGYTCEGCGLNKAIEVHHLVPVAGGGALLDFDNLMAVCADCHDNMHEQLKNGAFYWEIKDYLDAHR